MEILGVKDGQVATSDGKVRSVNELIWNYRSECCGAPIDHDVHGFSCSFCRIDCLIAHKSALKAQGIQIASVIDSLPSESRDAAVLGYYKSMENAGISAVHIFDVGAGSIPELPVELRR